MTIGVGRATKFFWQPRNVRASLFFFGGLAAVLFLPRLLIIPSMMVRARVCVRMCTHDLACRSRQFCDCFFGVWKTGRGHRVYSPLPRLFPHSDALSPAPSILQCHIISPRNESTVQHACAQRSPANIDSYPVALFQNICTRMYIHTQILYAKYRRRVGWASGWSVVYNTRSPPPPLLGNSRASWPTRLPFFDGSFVQGKRQGKNTDTYDLLGC